MKILYELVTVIGECRATVCRSVRTEVIGIASDYDMADRDVTERSGRRPGVRIRKSGDLPVCTFTEVYDGEMVKVHRNSRGECPPGHE